jgi:uncharacterized protein (TIGR03437 family)
LHAPNLTFRGGRILHNEIYSVGLQTTDLGCTYTNQSDGQGAEIAYNLCHDNRGASQKGIYLDEVNCNNYVIHHNVVWGTPISLVIRSVGSNDKVYNNTFAGTNNGLSGVGQLPGTELRNNIFTASVPNAPGAVLQNNLLPPTDPQFVNPAQGNFQLKPTSPAIEAGVLIPPYTDGYTGRAPDLGAYDHGLPPWKAGAGQVIATGVSAASYGPALAPESMAVVFGPKLATSPASAPSPTLPTTLAGTTVQITDGAGVDRLAPLFYVSPTQLAFEVPLGTAPGIALITITSGDGTISLSSAPISATAPGLFSANASGKGVAAAGVVRAKADGSQSYEPVAAFNLLQNQFVAVPIDLGPETDQVGLVLYGTGIRGRSSPAAVSVTVGGVNSQVFYAGAQNVYPGLDQVNVLLSRSLAGRGDVDIVLIVDGQPANTVTVNIR